MLGLPMESILEMPRNSIHDQLSQGHIHSLEEVSSLEQKLFPKQ